MKFLIIRFFKGFIGLMIFAVLYSVIYKKFINKNEVFLIEHVHASEPNLGYIDTALEAASAIYRQGVEKDIDFSAFKGNQWMVSVDYVPGDESGKKYNYWIVKYFPNFTTFACTYFINENGIRITEGEGCRHSK